jgi:hypothetical protein
LQKGKTLTHRFYYLNEDNRIMDALNPTNNEKAEWFEEYDQQRNEQRFRELLLWRGLGELLPNLILNTNPTKKGHDGTEYQPPCEELLSIWCALHTAIIASHLNTLDVALSVQHKFDGKLKLKKEAGRIAHHYPCSRTTSSICCATFTVNPTMKR